jgi:aspartyl-tRNA synthetase
LLAIGLIDFPLLEWRRRNGRYLACHASSIYLAKTRRYRLIRNQPGKVRANAYDMVINGVEVGGGSIRIHDRNLTNRNV